jgi:hypothetical protein
MFVNGRRAGAARAVATVELGRRRRHRGPAEHMRGVLGVDDSANSGKTATCRRSPRCSIRASSSSSASPTPGSSSSRAAPAAARRRSASTASPTSPTRTSSASTPRACWWSWAAPRCARTSASSFAALGIGGLRSRRTPSGHAPHARPGDFPGSRRRTKTTPRPSSRASRPTRSCFACSSGAPPSSWPIRARDATRAAMLTSGPRSSPISTCATAALAAVADPEMGPEQLKRALALVRRPLLRRRGVDPGDRAERKAPSPRKARKATTTPIDRAIGDERATLDPEDDALLLRIYQLLHGRARKGKKKALALRAPLRRRGARSRLDRSRGPARVVRCRRSPARPVVRRASRRPSPATPRSASTWTRASSIGATCSTISGMSRHVEVEPLRIAYRSTKQVLDFARTCSGRSPIPSHRSRPRSGAPVEHHEFPSPGRRRRVPRRRAPPALPARARATVAILARYPEQADAYFEALGMADIPNLRRIRAYEFAFRPGVEVTEIRR